EGNAAGHNGNQIRCYNCRGVGHFARECTVRPRRRDAAYLQTQMLIAQKEEAGIQLQAEEYDLMAAAANLDEIEEVNANFILMANLQQASSSSTQTDSTPVYDSDGSVKFCDSDLEVAFRRNAYFVRNLEGVDLLKGDRSTNLYTINLHNMASVSPICLMARASSTKSWLWHQRLSHLNFDTINDLARNDLVAGLPKFKYHKEHLCPSCEQGKSKRASHPPKSVPNSRQRLHLLHMDLYRPMRIASINGKRRKPDISFLHAFGALCYPKNDREDIGKLGAKGDIGFFIGYSADSCAFKVFNRRTKKIIETMNVSFDELSAMAFEQHSSKPRLQTTVRTVPPDQEPQVHQTSTASTSIADIAPIPTNSSSNATNIPITSQDVDELNPNAMIDGNTFVNPFANSSTSVAESSSS
nr:integrase, catalytic region, zinc finger, CCHC-type, peptidase aspartic, catalytic [Tanacetum cinerariifolium]